MNQCLHIYGRIQLRWPLDNFNWGLISLFLGLGPCHHEPIALQLMLIKGLPVQERRNKVKFHYTSGKISLKQLLSRSFILQYQTLRSTE